MDALSALAKGNEFYVNDELPAATEMYTLAHELDPSIPQPLSNRAAIHIRNKEWRRALDDANAALQVDNAHEVSYFRKGTACFELGEYELAKKAFLQGDRIRTQAGSDDFRKYSMWIRKCEAEIANDDEIAPMDQHTPPVQKTTPAPAPVPVAVPAAVSAPVQEPTIVEETKVEEAPAAPQIQWSFKQTDDTVTVDVLAKGVDPSDAKISIRPAHLKVIIKKDKKDVLVLDTPLFARIVVEDSRMRYMSSKVRIVLPKAVAESWPTLEGQAAPATATSNMAAASASAVPAALPQASSVPRPYASHRDWETIERQLQQEEENEKPEGDEALNKLFRDIYSKANEDTRRAMVKSFQTSGGTVLSTNWGEVKEKDYENERQAPNGMVWKDWEGHKLPQKDS